MQNIDRFEILCISEQPDLYYEGHTITHTDVNREGELLADIALKDGENTGTLIHELIEVSIVQAILNLNNHNTKIFIKQKDLSCGIRATDVMTILSMDEEEFICARRLTNIYLNDWK